MTDAASQTPSGGAAPTPPPGLPDLSAETYPFELVANYLDQTAILNMMAVPDGNSGSAAIQGSGGVTGFTASEALHRLQISQNPPTSAGVKAANAVGQIGGSWRFRWLLTPDDFVALPGKQPPSTALDASRQQRFVMLDEHFTFGDGEDGFTGFGTGRTFPMADSEPSKLIVGAAGNLMGGFGKLEGLLGQYVISGTLDSARGFTGNVIFRAWDWKKEIQTDLELPALAVVPDPDPRATYLILRAQKRDRKQKTGYHFTPDGRVDGLSSVSDLRLVDVRWSADGPDGLGSSRQIGQVVGERSSFVAFNFLDPAPGTAEQPIPYFSQNEFRLFGTDGNTVARFRADIIEGRTFTLAVPDLPGQSAIRFVGFGPIVNGSEQFEGVRGLMSDNSTVGIAPFGTSSLYVFRIDDPEGKFRAGF